jgi:hypothetical protein
MTYEMIEYKREVVSILRLEGQSALSNPLTPFVDDVVQGKHCGAFGVRIQKGGRFGVELRAQNIVVGENVEVVRGTVLDGLGPTLVGYAFVELHGGFHALLPYRIDRLIKPLFVGLAVRRDEAGNLIQYPPTSPV